MSEKALQAAIALVGTVLVAVAEAVQRMPELAGLFNPEIVHIVGMIGMLLIGKETLRRTPDYAPHELQFMERKSKP